MRTKRVPQPIPKRGWIGVDLDGTLARYSGQDYRMIGPPIPAMVNRVKKWLSYGLDVRIFTARAAIEPPELRAAAVAVIQAWCVKHIGEALPVTATKDFDMVELWDDRAVRVEHNTGKLISESTFI